MDSFLCWNACGAGGNKFKSDLYYLVRINNFSLLIICESCVQFIPHKAKFGFDKSEIYEACGFSGGIWVLWNSSVVSILPVVSVSQVITLRICNIGSLP